MGGEKTSQQGKEIDAILSRTQKLCRAIQNERFAPPVSLVYNPLSYAWKPYETYFRRFGRGRKSVLFLGMNPGPWGMAQTGVPFGEIRAVRDWMGIEEAVGEPPVLHPKRPVQGFSCKRSEVSGRRLWALVQERFGKPEDFFRDHFVINYCPILAFDENGKNITPDKLRSEDRKSLFAICDDFLLFLVRVMAPEWLIGIGKFAGKRGEDLLEAADGDGSLKTIPKLSDILHPSPANPQANAGWKEKVIRKLVSEGIWEEE